MSPGLHQQVGVYSFCQGENPENPVQIKILVNCTDDFYYDWTCLIL